MTSIYQYKSQLGSGLTAWVPAFAGMTSNANENHYGSGLGT